MIRAVSILGGGRSLALCPYDTEAIWTVNNVYRQAMKLTSLFLIHNQVYDGGGKPKYDWDEINRVSREKGFDVVSLHKIAGLDSKPFPLRSIIESLGSDYFTNSISYLVALAVYRKFDSIKLYGVDQRKDEDYASEKGAVEYWLGIARGRGMHISISEGSEVLK